MLNYGHLNKYRTEGKAKFEIFWEEKAPALWPLDGFGGSMSS